MVIIDGYNLLWVLHRAGEDFEEISDVQLCRIVGEYLKLTGENGQIIFDGTGPRDKSGFDDIINLDISFAGMNTDADTVIEDKIKTSTSPNRLTVVSSDRRLRRAARARKATAVKSEVFWSTLQKRLSQRRPRKEPAAKRHGISKSETEQWLEFFGLEQ